MKTLLTPLLLIFLSGVLWAFIVSPNKISIEYKLDKITELTNILKGADEINTKRNELVGLSRNITESQRNLLKTAIPVYSEENIIIFLIGLESLLLENLSPKAINIQLIDIFDTSIDENIQTVSFVLNFNSIEYRRFLNVLDSLSTWIKIINIKSIKISSGSSSTDDAGSEGSRVNFSIELTALFSKELIIENI